MPGEMNSKIELFFSIISVHYLYKRFESSENLLPLLSGKNFYKVLSVALVTLKMTNLIMVGLKLS